MIKTLEWQFECQDFEEESPSKIQQSPIQKLLKMEEEVDKNAVQLMKNKNPLKDMYRQSCISIVQEFGILLVSQNLEEISNNMITEDFETFILDSSAKMPIRFSRGPKEFVELFKGIRMQNRRVREVNVDVEKNTVCVLCNYESLNGDEDNIVEETAFELYSIREGRISKYIVSFGHLDKETQNGDPLEITRKDKMLARIKQINCALAGKPNLEEVASLLQEDTQYKIWRWNDFKCFTFSKNELVMGFMKLEENMKIVRVVPYDVTADPATKFIAGTYLYELEENSTGKKFTWLSNCIYEFDQDLHLTRITQQGELYKEGDVDIPFEVYDRSRLIERFNDSYRDIDASIDILYSDKTIYDCKLMTFSTNRIPNPGLSRGIKDLDRLINTLKILKTSKFEFVKPVDIFVDPYNESYDVVFGLICIQGPSPTQFGNIGDNINTVGVVRLAFENGKLAKLLQFFNEVRTPIPSLFNDKTFSCLNIK